MTSGHDDTRSRRYLLILSVGALGVVYGDIGTSPLYAMREAFHAAGDLAVTDAHVFGVLSLVFWALVIVVSVKYLIFVLRADNSGEGGIMALTALILPPNQRIRVRGLYRVLILLGLFGTALLYGDGMITPAISVLSAVEGFEIVAPAMESWVIPLSVVILVALFAIQRTGTGTVGAVFAPVMIVWFATIGILGGVQILSNPGVLAALNPIHAARFAVVEPKLAFLALGAIFLVTTGSEALYADMGHFGRRPIRLGWVFVVFPALVLNYFGQGALILADPQAIDNPFYRLAPGWALLPLVLLATAATVIASQALISGAYSLTMQAVQLGFLPRVDIDHTSPREVGQVYVSSINWFLMVACIGLVLTFRTSSNLAAAYGVAVTSTMVITTLLLYRVSRERWGWSRLKAGWAMSVFLAVDLAFFAANIVKIPAGGWFPLVVGGIIFVIMTTWRRGRRDLSLEIRQGQVSIERFIASIAQHPQRRVPGTAVYLIREAGFVPPAMLANLRHNEILHETIVLLTVRAANVAKVPQARRATVHDLGDDFYQVILDYGFMEEPDVPRALASIVDTEFGFDPSDASYFLAKESVVVKPGLGLRSLRSRLFSFLHRNSSSAAVQFSLPSDQVLEIGTQIRM
ncbi:MAG TPA: potassium transporter Kup [Acidimicrobiia bacterium]|nr:potassium transporter Kup [Acidimicrobiia bacterium]